MSLVRRRGALAAMVCAALLPVACGGDDGSEPNGFDAIPKRTIQAPEDETAPRWQKIAELRAGAGATRRLTVSRDALQWRVRWSCREQRIAIKVTPAPPSSNGRASGRCPGRGSATWVGTGPYTVDVRGSAGFRVIVEEELRTPLDEPAPAAVGSGAAREIARGRFAPIEAKGRGTAVLYRQPGGRLTLRMEGFATDPNPDLDVWLSTEAEPTTTRRIFAARHVRVRALKSTIGDQNYALPADADARTIRSVVVVNVGQRIAYAAAALMP